jgi:hypothetical protein
VTARDLSFQTLWAVIDRPYSHFNNLFQEGLLASCETSSITERNVPIRRSTVSRMAIASLIL